MIAFLGDIAFYLAALVFGFGLVLLYLSSKEQSKLLKTGAYVLSIIGILGGLCTGYYWVKFYLDGAYNSPWASYALSNHIMAGRIGAMSGTNSSKFLQMQQCMGSVQGKMMDEKTMMDMQGCMMEKVHGKEMRKEHESHH